MSTSILGWFIPATINFPASLSFLSGHCCLCGMLLPVYFVICHLCHFSVFVEERNSGIDGQFICSSHHIIALHSAITLGYKSHELLLTFLWFFSFLVDIFIFRVAWQKWIKSGFATIKLGVTFSQSDIPCLLLQYPGSTQIRFYILETIIKLLVFYCDLLEFGNSLV